MWSIIDQCCYAARDCTGMLKFYFMVIIIIIIIVTVMAAVAVP